MTPQSLEELYAENQRLKAVQAVGSKARLYVIAVIVLCFLSATFVILITVLRPTQDNTAILTPTIGIVVMVVTALLAAAFQQVNLAVNGRLSQLLELTAKSRFAEGQLVGIREPTPGIEQAARAEGKAEGVEAERTRKDENTP